MLSLQYTPSLPSFITLLIYVNNNQNILLLCNSYVCTDFLHVNYLHYIYVPTLKQLTTIEIVIAYVTRKQ